MTRPTIPYPKNSAWPPIRSGVRLESPTDALSRSRSPALVAEYQTRLPDKQLLRAKLHEFYELAASAAAGNASSPPAHGKSNEGAR